jgi:dimeric dUTPase (all-alpha-NTP-PPase superfamily)
MSDLNPFINQPEVDNTTYPPMNKEVIYLDYTMSELQRYIYEIAIKTEWMSEDAFLMAWNDYLVIAKDFHLNNGVVPGGYFIKWLLDKDFDDIPEKLNHASMEINKTHINERIIRNRRRKS